MKRVSFFLITLCLVFVFNSVDIYALPPNVLKWFDSFAGFVDPAGSDCVGPGCACSVSGTVSLTGSDNEEKVWNFLIAKGSTPIAAAGIMGNLKAESGFDPGIEELAGGAGFGLAQWTGSRRTELEAEAAAQGVDVADLGFQLEYLYNEANERRARDDPSVSDWEDVQRQDTVADAATNWEHNFERPEVAGQQVRIDFGEEILNKYGGGVSGSNPTTGALDCSNTSASEVCEGTTSLPIPSSTQIQWYNASAHGTSVSHPGKTNGHNTVVYPSNAFGAESVENSTTDVGEAVDVGVSPGTKVFAPTDGEVLYSGTIHRDGSDGYMVIIESSNKKCVSVSAHLTQPPVSVGESVQPGQEIGTIVDIANDHLHFELWVDGQPVNIGRITPDCPINSCSTFSDKAEEIWNLQKQALLGEGAVDE